MSKNRHGKFKLKERKIECLMSEDFPSELTDTIELYNLKSYKWLVEFLKNKKTENLILVRLQKTYTMFLLKILDLFEKIFNNILLI